MASQAACQLRADLTMPSLHVFGAHWPTVGRLPCCLLQLFQGMESGQSILAKTRRQPFMQASLASFTGVCGEGATFGVRFLSSKGLQRCQERHSRGSRGTRRHAANVSVVSQDAPRGPDIGSRSHRASPSPTLSEDFTPEPCAADEFGASNYLCIFFIYITTAVLGPSRLPTLPKLLPTQRAPNSWAPFSRSSACAKALSATLLSFSPSNGAGSLRAHHKGSVRCRSRSPRRPLAVQNAHDTHIQWNQPASNRTLLPTVRLKLRTK